MHTPPVAAFEASATSGCAPLTVNFTDNSTNFPQTWIWYIGASTYSEQNPTHVFSEPGTYNVLLMVSNLDGNDVHSAVITVYENPTVIITAQEAICEGSSHTIIVESGFAAYEWSNGSTIKGFVNFTQFFTDFFINFAPDKIFIYIGFCSINITVYL